MKKIPLALSAIALAAMQISFAKSINELDVVNRIATQSIFAEQQPAAIWPGFHPYSTPIVIDFWRTRHAYALNYHPGKLPWKKLPATKFPTYYLEHSDIANLEAYDGKFATIDGELSFVDEEDSYTIRFFGFRSQYYLQHESPIDPKNISSLHIADNSFNDLPLLKLLILEKSILLASLKQADDTNKENLLRDALAVHQYRYGLLSPKAREFENAWEVYFGTNLYMTMALEQLSDADFSESIGDGSLLCDIKSDYWLPVYCHREISDLSSAIFGRALDKKLNGLDWKPRVEKEFKAISQIAVENAHLSDQQAQDLTNAAMSNALYGYQSISDVINKTMVPYLEEMKIAKGAYHNLSGIEVMRMSAYGDDTYALFSDNYYWVDRSTNLIKDIHIAFGDINHPSITTLPYLAVHYVRKDFNQIDQVQSYITFKISDNAVLVIDGNKISAYDFIRYKKKVTFSQLDVIDDYTKNIKNILWKGTLDASSGKIIIIPDVTQGNFVKTLKTIDSKKQQKKSLFHQTLWVIEIQ